MSTPPLSIFIIVRFGSRRVGASDTRGVLTLRPLNNNYPAVRADVPPVIIIGTMVEHRRGSGWSDEIRKNSLSLLD
ncbi:MAG: hypothetical protein LBP99_00700 [Azoarcus sp.]|nr:hypothetical protein [Azoarcus sp.]